MAPLTVQQAHSSIMPSVDSSSSDAIISETVQTVLDYVQKFNIRLNSNTSRGRLLLNDTSIQSMFIILSQLSPKLLSIIRYLEDCRSYYETLQDKLTSIKDASEALDILRVEHQERLRMESFERERARLEALNQKLAMMRVKKQQESLRLQKEIHSRQLVLRDEQEMQQDKRLSSHQQPNFTHLLHQSAAYVAPSSMPTIAATAAPSIMETTTAVKEVKEKVLPPFVVPTTHIEQPIVNVSTNENNATNEKPLISFDDY